MNARGLRETLANIATVRQRLGSEMRRADADKAAAEARLADLTAISSALDGYADDLRAKLEALQADAEQGGGPSP
jgi:hypothetical protein